MKRNLLFLLLIMICSGFAALAEKTPEERSFCNQVKNFLQTEGYTPNLDSAGNVVFKCSGHEYHISVSTYKDGFYVDCYGVMSAANANHNAILEACVQTSAALNFVRCFPMNSDSIKYGCCGCFSNFYQFKAVLRDYIEILEKADTSLKEIYTEYAANPAREGVKRSMR